jgi:hypothetical protein
MTPRPQGSSTPDRTPLKTRYSFLKLLEHIDPLLRNEHLTGTLYGVLDGKTRPQLRLVPLLGTCSRCSY